MRPCRAGRFRDRLRRLPSTAARGTIPPEEGRGAAPMPTIRRTPITEPAAWTRAELEADASWRLPLQPEHVADLDRALAAVKARGLPFHAVTQDDFPLPAWEGLLARTWEILTQGARRRPAARPAGGALFRMPTRISCSGASARISAPA